MYFINLGKLVFLFKNILNFDMLVFGEIILMLWDFIGNLDFIFVKKWLINCCMIFLWEIMRILVK